MRRAVVMLIAVLAVGFSAGSHFETRPSKEEASWLLFVHRWRGKGRRAIALNVATGA